MSRLAHDLDYDVTLRDDDKSELSENVDVVVISQNVSSSQVANKYDEDYPVGVVNLEHSSWDDHSLTTTPGAPNSVAGTGLHASTASPLGNGLAYSNTAFSADAAPAEIGNWLTAPGRVQNITAHDNSSFDVGFTVEADGDLLNSQTAAGRRVALGYTDTAIGLLNDTGWRIFDNATVWATGQRTAPATGYTSNEEGQRLTETSPGDYALYGWDNEGRLTGIDTNGYSIDRGYTGDGQLVNITTGTSSEDLLWDTTTSVPQPAVKDGSRYTYGTSRIGYTDTSGGELFAQDHLGSTIQTPATADQTRSTQYGPFGQPIGATTTDPAFGYRGELATTNLIHLRARDYDPDTGAFLSRDPLDGVNGSPVVANPYHYANNNPVNLTDPLGLRPGDDVFGLGQITAACGAAGGRLVQYSYDGVGPTVCLEPPSPAVEGRSCFPPYTSDGNPIVWHNGSCQVKTTSVTCARGAFIPGANRICRNGRAITRGATVALIGSGIVLTGGALAGGAGLVGGRAGFTLGGGSLSLAGGFGSLTTGGAIVISPGLAQTLAGAGSIGLGLTHMASGNSSDNFERMPAGNNQAANETARAARTEAERILGRKIPRGEAHDVISGQGYSSYAEILEALLEAFG